MNRKSDMHVRHSIKYPKRLQQPKDDYNYYYCIKNIFDGSLHGYVSVYKPKKNSNNNEYDCNIY
ncbi:MAG: hypothetical protein LH615_07715 [Ferruginibacter sp.]|nr:hypothetical protein [Ferruginibacter sp.]